MASTGEDVYATLLMNDQYLPGALVVAHSLRDAGTTKKIAVLICDVSIDAIEALRRVFDFIIPVERIANDFPANLHLMNRPDLHSTFTKITLWKQLQFRKIVYVDADMVAIRAPDELFDLPHAFSAAPDIGWPDIFNTGLMVLTPNLGDYYALLAMAQRGISFDGADQGLLNMHFKNTFNRLSFTYNVTPSAHYQYLPAFKHFQSSISMAHFIGQSKPWTQGRAANSGSTPYDEMIGRWWAVYDKHYRESSVESSPQGAQSIVQYHTKGEFHPIVPVIASSYSYNYQPEQTESETVQQAIEQPFDASQPFYASQPLYASAEVPRVEEEAYVPPVQSSLEGNLERGRGPEPVPEPAPEPVPEIEYTTWDAAKAPPPPDSKPEASNFPVTHYDMSSDPTPFKAPERYPDPPKNMYYEVPKTPTYQKPAPIFPWELNQTKARRVFPEDDPEKDAFQTRDEILRPIDAPVDADTSTPVTPTTPPVQHTPTDPWQTYTRGNAWDEIPEIERYIGKLQKNRKGNIQVLQGYSSGQVTGPGERRGSIRVTDFPSELERPSLPVTPAPIRKPSFWGTERDEEGDLPSAEGVPSQEDWDPAIQLEQLARRQSDVLASKLGGDSSPAREIPLRPLPYGSEGVTSPTYVARAPPEGAATASTGSTTIIEKPSYAGPGAAWEKDEEFPIKETPLGPTEDEEDVLET